MPKKWERNLLKKDKQKNITILRNVQDIDQILPFKNI